MSRPIWLEAMAAIVCTVLTPWRCWVTPMPQPMMELGAVAYMRAALRMSSGSQPQMSATLSGVYFSMVCHHSSKPLVWASMKALSCMFSDTITLANAFMKARLQPFLIWMYKSAMRAVSMERGSTTMIFAPFSLAFTMRRATMGCEAEGL